MREEFVQFQPEAFEKEALESVFSSRRKPPDVLFHAFFDEAAGVPFYLQHSRRLDQESASWIRALGPTISTFDIRTIMTVCSRKNAVDLLCHDLLEPRIARGGQLFRLTLCSAQEFRGPGLCLGLCRHHGCGGFCPKTLRLFRHRLRGLRLDPVDPFTGLLPFGLDPCLDLLLRFDYGAQYARVHGPVNPP